VQVHSRLTITDNKQIMKKLTEW